jgi:hypothetical protein
VLSPEVRLEGRYDTSDRGLGESQAQLEVSVPFGTRARLAAGGYASRSQDDRYSLGDVHDYYLGIAVRPWRWLRVSGEATVAAGQELCSRAPHPAASPSALTHAILVAAFDG